jgi:ribosomal protein L24
MMQPKLKIRKGDEVIILTGKDKGKKGQVLEVLPTKTKKAKSQNNDSEEEEDNNEETDNEKETADNEKETADNGKETAQTLVVIGLLLRKIRQ